MNTNPIFAFILLLLFQPLLLLGNNKSNSNASTLVFDKQITTHNCEVIHESDIKNIENCTRNHNSASWYSFTTPSRKTAIDLLFINESIGKDASIAVYDETKTTLIWSECNVYTISNKATSFVNLETDYTYHVQISSSIESQGDFNIEISYSAVTPPDNDLCVNATELFGGTLECDDFDNQQIPDLSCATPDPEATGNCVEDTDPAIWYTFSTNSEMSVNSIFQGHGPSNPFEIYSTSSGCSGLVFEVCSENILTFIPEPSTTYYMLFAGVTFSWQIDGALFDNDCTSPLPALEGGPGVYNTWVTTACQSDANFLPCQNDNAVWFEHTTGCNTGDVNIFVEEFSPDWGGPAEEIAISVYLDDCSTLASAYDPNGQGYVCQALSAGEQLNLENIPPGTNLLIAFSSDDNYNGYTSVTLTETNSGISPNDVCSDAIGVNTGLNTGLSNLCATEDVTIPNCSTDQSQASVWYEMDIGSTPQDLTIDISSLTIVDPAIAAFDDCGGIALGSSCNGSLELLCVENNIKIEIGSALGNEGMFDLDITMVPSTMPSDPTISSGTICSGDQADISVVYQNGESGDFIVSVSPNSSSNVNGAMDQSFSGTGDFLIDDILTNTVSTIEEVVYTVQPTFSDFSCPATPFEVSVMVYPPFEAVPLFIEECLPEDITVDANAVIIGGTAPYASYNWNWNGASIGTSQFLTTTILDEGTIVLMIEDAVGCTFEANVDVIAIPYTIPTFVFPLDYCTVEDDVIDFPTTSQEGIVGVWDPASIDVDEFPNQTIDITFTPNEDFCAEVASLEIEILSAAELEFSLPSILCAQQGIFVFPEEDDNGNEGYWEYSDIDLTGMSGSFSNLFTGNESNCNNTFEYFFEVENSIEATFNIPADVCLQDTLISFQGMSLEGYNGTWEFPSFNPSTVVGSTFVNTWTAESGSSSCLTSTDIAINILLPLQPMFNIPTSLCSTDSILVMPTTTPNGLISGQWSPTQINPTLITGDTQIVFTPSSQYCANAASFVINVAPEFIPEFNLPDEYCVNNTPLALPLISNNNIPGTWNYPELDPMFFQSGQIVDLVFTPNDTIFCTDTYTHSITLEPLKEPTFDLPEYLCWDDLDFVFPETSTNNIEGVWSEPTIDVQASLGATVSSTFMPANDFCNASVQMEIQVIAPFNVELVITAPADCEATNGRIEIIGTVADLEFSIDGGLTWTSEILYDALPAGSYNIDIRSSLYPTCELTLFGSLSVNDAPEITDLVAMDVLGCDAEDGSITVMAIGQNLEYSLDGVEWQSENCFKDLSPNFYTIYIKEENVDDCIIEGSVEVLDFPKTIIIDVELENVSDCGLMDGFIQIEATGQNLEYSIDGGASWSSNNTFSGLAAGLYEIEVRSVEDITCLETLVEELFAPDAPFIMNVQGDNPSNCFPVAGTILIEATGSNIEYSIDGGINWTDLPLFENLEEGMYDIIVRDKDRNDCFADWQYELNNTDDGLSMPTFDIQPISECNATDGIITISIAEPDVEYSIDNVQSWQTDPVFDALGAGVYVIEIRQINNNDCTTNVQVVIPNEDCPCEDLIVMFEENIPECYGDFEASVSVSSIEGMLDPNVEFLWDFGETTETATGLTTGQYTLTILYDNGCTWTEQINIELPEPIEFQLLGEDTDCPNSLNGSIMVVNAAGGIPGYMYSIDGVNYQNEPLFDGLSQGEYTVSLKDMLGCIESDAIDIEIEFELDHQINLPEFSIIELGDSIVLDPQIELAEIEDFLWTANGEEIALELLPTVSPNETTTYSLTIYYGDCSETETATIEVNVPVEPPLEKEKLYLGNAFNPNTSDENSTFFIQSKDGAETQINSFRIYDRWGNLVFEIDNPRINEPEDGWNGNFNGKKVNAGVFVFMLDYESEGERIIETGTVTLIQ